MKKSRQPNTWAAILEFPPVITGLAGAFMLTLEGEIFGVILVLLLVALHRYAIGLLDRTHATVDQFADWSGVRAMTTFSCIDLPVYLFLTRH